MTIAQSGDRCAGRIASLGVRPVHGLVLAITMTIVAGAYLYSRSTWWLPEGVLTDLRDPEVSSAVGMIVSTIQKTLPSGRILDIPIATGSCFLISPDGVALTNRHVVQELKEFQASPLKARLELEQTIRLEVKFYVFIREDQYEAEVLHTGGSYDEDYAILKLPVRNPARYFRLCDSIALDRGDTVFALGYPGIARKPLSIQEGAEEVTRQMIAATVGSRLRQQFKLRDFEYVQTKGAITRIVQEGSRTWIEHDAAIHHGSSGGPLLTSDCRVVGINTRGQGPVVGDEEGNRDIAPILQYALGLGHVKREIVPHAPAAVWR